MLNGWKSYIGFALYAVAAIAAPHFPEHADLLDGLKNAALGLAGIGVAHKLAKTGAAKAAAAVLLCVALLPGCATSETGAQDQKTSQGTTTNTAHGGILGHYIPTTGKGSRRVTKAPVINKDGSVATDEAGNVLYTVIEEDATSGPIVLIYGGSEANIEQSPQGSQAGSGTQNKGTDTSTPTNDVKPTTNVSGVPK